MSSIIKYLNFTIGLFLISSCSMDSFEYRKELQATNDILGQLIDSMVYFPVYPPPPPPSYNNYTGQLLSDSAKKEHDKFVYLSDSSQKEYDKLIALIDTSLHVLYIRDSLLINEDYFDHKILDLLKDSSFTDFIGVFDSYIKHQKVIRIINLNEIKISTKFRLIISNNHLEFYQNTKVPKYNYKYYGLITLSRIYFDKDYKHGFLVCNYDCGNDCNYSLLIFIQKNNLKWEIIKYKRLHIA
jgi:hypothetical protein